MAHLDIKRLAANEDLAEVEALLRKVERADGVRPLSDHLWIDLRQGGRPGFAGLLAFIPGHGHPVAYCQVSRGNESWSLDLIIDPHHRYDMASIGPEMLAAAIEIISEEGGASVLVGVRTNPSASTTCKQCQLCHRSHGHPDASQSPTQPRCAGQHKRD